VILQIALAFVGTMGFSIIFNVPRKELLLCGIAGAAGWAVHRLIFQASPDFIVAAILFAAITVTCISRILSYARKMPVTVYMIPGVIPLVPGAGIYYTMFHAVMGENTQALILGIETLRNAGVIAVGLLITLSLPPKLFSFIKS
jgi:uncharacterized membrane protein YjjB (DUF3815 family)